MIKTEYLTPEVYYNNSRDFQLLGRIYDIIFGYLKNNINSINNITDINAVDSTLIDLVTSTLGFKKLHNYTSEQLRGLCSIFIEVIRCKGTIKSIETVLNMLANVYNCSTKIEVLKDPTDNSNLIITIPPQMPDITLFYDILNYILPAGITISVSFKTEIEKSVTSKMKTTDSIECNNYVNISQLAFMSEYTNTTAQNVISGKYDNFTVPGHLDGNE